LLLGVSVPLPAHAATIQDFDGPGTAYRLTQYHQPPGASVQLDGPSGNYLRLAYAGGADPTINTVDFDLSDPGVYPIVVADFDFRIQGDADGLGFALINTAVFGLSGPAYIAETAAIPASLGVGFDIFQNWETGDPSSNFIELTYDGQILATAAPGVPLASGAFLHVTLRVEAIAGGAEVTLTLTPFGGEASTPLDRFFVPGFEPYEARAAFGARTGGGTANHDIDNVMVSFVPEPSTMSLLLLGLAGLAARRQHRG
jgi:hypothetical protein